MLRIVPLDDGSGVALIGILDLATDGEARAALERALSSGSDLTLDLTGLEFMDSTGLNIIAEALRTMGPEGHLTIRVNHGIIRRVLDVSGLWERPNVTAVST